MPTSGEIIIRGRTRTRTIKQEPPGRNQAKIAVVFQNPALFDSLTIGENVAFELLELSDLDDARISDLAKIAIERVGLRQEVLDLYPPQLSGGMQKRVSFARAVTFDPDSPTGGVCCAPDVLLLVSITHFQCANFSRVAGPSFLTQPCFVFLLVTMTG